MVILPGENETQKCVVEGFLKPWQNKKGQNVCCDAPKMQVFSKNCRFLCFSREEELSVMPSKNKLAYEKTAGQRRQFWKIHSFLEHPNKCFVSFCFFRAIANWCIIQSGEKNVKNWHFLLNLDGLLFWMKNFFVFLFNASQFQSHKDQCRLFVFQSVLQGYQPAKSSCVLNHRLDTLQ